MRFDPKGRLASAALALVLAASLANGAHARQRDFTIEQAMSAPFPSPMVAAPTGGRVAWVNNAKGARNVWVAESGPDGQARALTTFAGDEGFDLGELAWDPAGKTVYYTRGGSLEGGGPVNATSRPEGAAPQEIWAVSIEGGAPRSLGQGRAPTPSPKGDQVAWLVGGQVFVQPSASGPGQQLFHDRGQITSIIWSPDGARLAFTSQRGDHGFLGVYDFAAKTIRWMNPSVDTDFDPVWSPDGKRVAFIRIPTTKPFDFTAHPAGVPWSIQVADPATGETRAIWTASPGAGAVFFPLGQSGNLRWAAGDRLVFPWEKTGWAHLYSVSAAGGEAAALSPPGDYEVFNFGLAPDGQRAVWSSNQGDLDRRRLWEAPILGGAAKAVTTGATIADYPVVASDGRVLGLQGSARDPMRPVVIEGARTRDLAKGAIPVDFPAAKLVEPQAVIFKSADGLMVHGQLFLPKGKTSARGPALLFFHGGPFRQMVLGWHPMDAYAYFYAMNQYLASQGYVVLSVNYRGGTGYGASFRQPVGFGPSGASEDNDIVGAARFLGARPDVDPARIGIYGGSYGGLMTALGLSRHSDLLAAGVDYAGVHDWKGLLPDLVAPGAPPARGQTAWESSALSTVDKWRSPVLVVHADDDRNVPFSESVKLIEALRGKGVETEQLVLPDEIHDLLRSQSWLSLFHATDDFFQRKLKR